ncbi:hydroxyisourate hydrolase [Jatrophihabitans sp.]|uniref:hydroxyisourate hydrolase n=1 Tax=Jatrophihabitans sp. TaxID=1932789 RepID=UPI0030C66A61|nr:hydroxyisourate hydrolase [Jatrophihabitans sp.]
MSVSTHVLDAVRGVPAAGVAVHLTGASGKGLRSAVTDADGRVPDLAGELEPGVYRLTFDVAGYLGPDTFYPEVTITFRIAEAAAHHHVPLLLSPFAYSTYRGS